MPLSIYYACRFAIYAIYACRHADYAYVSLILLQMMLYFLYYDISLCRR